MPNEKLEEFKQEIKQSNEKLEEIKNEKKKQAKTIIVGGYDKFNQLGEKPNNKKKYGSPFIGPPLILSLDYSSLLSYSVYSAHSVLVTEGSSLLGIGKNTNGLISSSLSKTEISQFTEFSIRDHDFSCLLFERYSLYVFKKQWPWEAALLLRLCNKWW